MQVTASYSGRVPDQTWDPDEYVYVQIADRFAEQIAAGDLAPGAKLPSEVELSEEFGVARLTARRAVRLLVERGLVRTLPGKGTFVRRETAED